MVAIPFPTSSAPGVVPNETNGRLVNVFAEPVQSSPPSVILKRVPGLNRIGMVEGKAHTRALHLTGTTVLVVYDERLHGLTHNGDGTFTLTDIGALTGSDLVTIAQNNAEPLPHIVAVTDDGVFNLFTGSPPTTFADGDLPAPNSVAVLNGYFLFTTGDGKVFASDLNAVTVNALSFSTTPGNLIRGVSVNNEFYAFGASFCCIYRDAGLQPFPLQLVTTIQKGLLSKFAVAGWQPGWASVLMFVSDDNVVYRMNGYSPQRVSTHSVERKIERLADKTNLEAIVYSAAGHHFWALKSDEWTWVYDLTTGEWHERKSYNQENWRASCSVKAFDRWIVGDVENSLLYAVSEREMREYESPLVALIESNAVEQFPAYVGVPRADFRFTTGVGIAPGQDPMQTAPKVSISWSDDGGFRWSSPLMRQLGPQGTPEQLVTLNRTGLSGPYGRKWRISCSDPVQFGLRGGEMVAEGRSA